MMDGDFHWNRAHFGAWCVTSAPLVLGADLHNSSVLNSIIDIVANTEAIAVNQAWHGHPGGLVWSESGGGLGYPVARDCDLANGTRRQSGWSTQLEPVAGSSGALLIQAPAAGMVGADDGGCLTLQGSGYAGGVGTNVRLAITPCNASSAAQLFVHNNVTGVFTAPFAPHDSGTGRQLCIAIKETGPVVWASYNSCGDRPNNAFFLHTSNGTLEGEAVNATKCLGVELVDPASTFQNQRQAWAKPLGGSSVAVLLINPDSIAHRFVVPLANLTSFPSANPAVTLGNGAAAISVRDIWARKALAPLAAGEATLNVSVGPLDSAFLKLGDASTWSL